MRFISIIFLLATLLLGGCSSAENTSPAKEKTVVYGALTDPYSLNPFIGVDAACTEMQSLLFNALVKINGKKELEHDLAQKWSIDESGKKYTFYLNQQATWHDGQKMDAHDVIFTFEKILNPSNAIPVAGDYQNIAAVRPIGNYTVEFELKEPQASFLSKIAAVFILPKHLLEKVENFRECIFNEHPIGTGPFKFAERKKANYIKFVANKAYFKNPPLLDAFYYRIVPDGNVLAMQLSKGEIDVSQIDAQGYAMLKQNPDVKLVNIPGQAYTYIALNNNLDIFSNKLVRKAIALGHERQAVIKNILNEHAHLAVADLPPASWGFDTSLEPLKYNPDESLRLLAQAGWQKNGQGILEKNGKTFAFTLLVTNKNKKMNDLALAFRQDMLHLGIDVQIIPMEFNALRQKHLSTGNYESYIMSQRLGPDPDSRYLAWHSGSKTSGSNLSGYENHRVNELFDEGKKILDQEVRKKIYHEIQKILLEEQPYIFHNYPELIVGIRSNVQGVLAQGTGAKDNIFWNIEQWDKI